MTRGTGLWDDRQDEMGRPALSLEKRKAATFEKELDKQREELEQNGAALGRQAFACREDAETAAGAWLMQAGYHRLTAQVDAEQMTLKRDRPGRL